MSLLSKFKSGLMTLFAGIEYNNGTTPRTLPQPNLEPNAYKNPNGSTLDLRDSTGGIIDFSEASAGVHSRIQAVVNNSLNILNRQNYPLNIGTNDTTRLTILGNGNVGIGGNASPAQALEVYRNSDSGSAGGYAGISLRNDH